MDGELAHLSTVLLLQGRKERVVTTELVVTMNG